MSTPWSWSSVSISNAARCLVERVSVALASRGVTHYSELARGDLGVETVLVAAGRVVVGQADESLLRRGDSALELDLVRLRGEFPGEVVEGTAGGGCVGEAIEGDLLALVAQHH